MASSELPQFGKYDVVARIAQGGMAEIFLAKQHGIGGFSRRVVLKCILPLLAEEPRFVKMFMEEARLASQIHHPNVVQIFDVGKEEKTFFIAMEFIDGLSVGAMMNDEDDEPRTLPVPVAGEIIAQACAGLHAAHKLTDEDGTPLNLVHRDISPANLMVTRDGVVKIVDFGIAKAVDSAVTTRTGNLKGKYAYMSPEQVRGHPLDRRSDLFSLGTILYELLTGQRLFHRNGELAVLVAIIEDDLPVAHDINPQVPEMLSDVILRSLERDREKRFNTAAEMGVAVREILGKMGHYTSAETLARYLDDECSYQMSNRKVEQVDFSTPSNRDGPSYTPQKVKTTVEPIQHEDSGASDLPEIIDLPPPKAPAKTKLKSVFDEAQKLGIAGKWLDESTLTSTQPLRGQLNDSADEPHLATLPDATFDELDEVPTTVRRTPRGKVIESQDQITVLKESLSEEDIPPAPIRGGLSSSRMQRHPDDLEGVVVAENLPLHSSDPTLDLSYDTDRSEVSRAMIAAAELPHRDHEYLEHSADTEESDELPSVSVELELDKGEVEHFGDTVRLSSSKQKVDGADDSQLFINTEKKESSKASRKTEKLPANHDRKRPNKLISLLIVVTLLAVAGLLSGYYYFFELSARPSGQALLFAQPPSYRLETLQKELEPFASYLEKRIDRPVKVVTTPDYSTLQQKVVAGDVHFANMPALLYVLAREENPDIKLLAAHAFAGNQTEQSYIIARDDSGIHNIEQLQGRRFCYADRRSTTGFLMPRSFLRSKGMDPDNLFEKARFSDGHIGVMEDIIEGYCDAGAVISSAWLTANDLGIKGNRFRLVASAGDVTRGVVCASPRLPTSLTESLRKALLNFDAQRDLGRSAVSPIFVVDQFVKVQDDRFEIIEKAARAEKMIP